ncbi:MAG: addiction module protein [Pirellulales bacterium]|nr:addiction module protein [Pirellulales bacterium]
MNTDFEQLFQAAMHLPEVQRVELADLLYESLDVAADPDVAEAWRREVIRRLAAFDDTRDGTTRWEEIEERLTRRLHGPHAD